MLRTLPAMEDTKDPQAATLGDQDVIRRVLGGEKALYEVLMRRYNQLLFRAVRSYLPRREDVEDAMQETYLKAYAKLDQFKGEAAFSTWLIRIGINEALQRLRKEKRMTQLRTPIDEGYQQLPDPTQMNPEKQTIQRENQRILEQAIDQLPEGYRAVYMLREVEGLSGAETAVCLDISETNVKVRLHRAKAMLKETIWGHHAEQPVFQFGDAHCDNLVKRVLDKL